MSKTAISKAKLKNLKLRFINELFINVNLISAFLFKSVFFTKIVEFYRQNYAKPLLTYKSSKVMDFTYVNKVKKRIYLHNLHDFCHFWIISLSK